MGPGPLSRAIAGAAPGWDEGIISKGKKSTVGGIEKEGKIRGREGDKEIKGGGDFWGEE